MRKVLQEGTWIRLSQGELYKITGKPIGEGGGSIVYPCKKISYLDGKITVSEIDYALKECFPLSAAFVFERREDGEIVSASITADMTLSAPNFSSIKWNASS